MSDTLDPRDLGMRQAIAPTAGQRLTSLVTPSFNPIETGILITNAMKAPLRIGDFSQAVGGGLGGVLGWRLVREYPELFSKLRLKGLPGKTVGAIGGSILGSMLTGPVLRTFGFD